MIKEKDSIFALPNRKETGFIARLENFKTGGCQDESLGSEKKKIFF